jgi:hypothetical protein
MRLQRRPSGLIRSTGLCTRSNSILVGWSMVICASILSAAETDQEIDARKGALDLAGAFSNDGFKMRDGHWCGTIKPREHALIAVNLYAGNQYWFTAGATGAAQKIDIAVYDETGSKMTTESYDEGQRAAAGFSAPNSGQYYVSVGLIQGSESSFCLVYSYK